MKYKTNKMISFTYTKKMTLILLILLLMIIIVNSNIDNINIDYNNDNNNNKYMILSDTMISICGTIILNEGMKKTVSTTSFKTLAEIDAISSSTSSSLVNSSLILLQKQLPFILSEWPSIYTAPCPHYKRTQKVDRGHSFSHYQIWLDFVYYDYDVIKAVNNKEFKNVYTSTSFSSTSSIFIAYENGTLYKDGILYNDNDIIIIFEDKIDIVVNDLKDILIDELKNMNTDILYLGWCYGKSKSNNNNNNNNNNNIPLCSHAYALTRRGAKQVIAYYNLCGPPIDEQLAHMIKNNYISYRLVNTTKYIDKFHNNYDKGQGIIQKKRIH